VKSRVFIVPPIVFAAATIVDKNVKSSTTLTYAD
jgi:hypothetical protein